MPLDFEIEQGIRCTASFKGEGDVQHSYPGCLLKFSHKYGGDLEIPMGRNWDNNLVNVTLESSGAMFLVPTLTYRGCAGSMDGEVNYFSFTDMLVSPANCPVAEVEVDRAEFEVERLGNYIGQYPVSRSKVGGREEVVHCTGMILHEIDLKQLNARAWIDAGYRLSQTTNTGFEAIPVHKVILDLGKAIPIDEFSRYVRQLAYFWEFMLHRPVLPGSVIYRSKHHGHFVRHMFKEAPEARDPGSSFQTGLLQMPWSTCAPHLPLLLERWMTLDLASAWMNNLMRLIHFREMPSDIRFFMAYTALHGFASELKGMPTLAKRSGKEEDKLWNDFEGYWERILFLMAGEAHAYTDRLVRTRHHFAHLSRGEEDILKSDQEFSYAYFRMVAVLKIMYMDSSGVPESVWTTTLSQWALRIMVAEQHTFAKLVLGPS